MLVIKISWIWRDFKLYFVILNFPDRTTREGGKSEYLLLGPSYMVFILKYPNLVTFWHENQYPFGEINNNFL